MPPHDPVNHCQVAPSPKLPPVTVSVFAIPLQLLLLDIETPEGAVDKLTTETANDDDELVPQLLPAVTLMLPLSPVEPEVTVIDVEPFPPVINQPEGTLQV